MIYAGILHYADQRDCFFLENGKLRIRLMVAKNDISTIYLHTRDKYLSIEQKDTRACCEMTKYATDFGHDYFMADVTVNSIDGSEHANNPDILCLRYFFELIDSAGARIWYGDSRFFSYEPQDVETMFDCPILSRQEQTFVIPDWAKDAVVYQIFPSRFATTDQVDDAVWYQEPISWDADLHGSLRGITERLTYLKELGVDVIYLTPIFQSNTSHKYDTIDYYHVDPSLGNDEDLHELIDNAHECGLRVMLDGVFNHTSTDFFAFKDIQQNGRNSRYYNWYYIDSLPLNYGSQYEVPSYQSFAFFGGMPKLRVSNPEVADYIIGVAKYYIEEFHIDGWRLDVGDEIGHDFWRRFRKEIKAVDPDALIVGEVWHYAPDFLQGDQWDSVMNYAFYKSVSSIICDESLRPSDFLAEQGFLQGQYHTAVLPVMWNLIDSHDTCRFLCRAGGDKRKLRLAAAMQMLLPGTPFLYYGDEVGMNGGNDPDNRRGMLWDKDRQDLELYAWYQRLTYFRHIINDIPKGSYKFTTYDNVKRILEYHLNSGEILIFHPGNQETTVKEYYGYLELLSDEKFDGNLHGYDCVLLKHQ
ncbi:glycoside hydrolase family 13 protein [Lachnobacterium bovis]|uniref:glycoside hydrolase family 13 protein n=1 Tax=Lachnobacterium bovis TaxID=140626 RepID=UPI0003B5DC81|nr:glycoside hydrolase family 13 protein [Lachnobacterium bovis]